MIFGRLYELGVNKQHHTNTNLNQHSDFNTCMILKAMTSNVYSLILKASQLLCILFEYSLGFSPVCILFDMASPQCVFSVYYTDVASPRSKMHNYLDKQIFSHNCIIFLSYGLYNYVGTIYDVIKSFEFSISRLDESKERKTNTRILMILPDYNLHPHCIVFINDSGAGSFHGNRDLVKAFRCIIKKFSLARGRLLNGISHQLQLTHQSYNHWLALRIPGWPFEKPYMTTARLRGYNGHPSDLQTCGTQAPSYGKWAIIYILAAALIFPCVSTQMAAIAMATDGQCYVINSEADLRNNSDKIYDDAYGVVMFSYNDEKMVLDCFWCYDISQIIEVKMAKKKVRLLVKKLQHHMKNPGLQTMADGRTKSLYLSSPKSIEEKLRPNLKKTIEELGLQDGCELCVADVTNPTSLIFKIKIKQ
ncbi:unnamed protein product, partial [Meganyctiphanes norvegica]